MVDRIDTSNNVSGYKGNSQSSEIKNYFLEDMMRKGIGKCAKKLHRQPSIFMAGFNMPVDGNFHGATNH